MNLTQTVAFTATLLSSLCIVGHASSASAHKEMQADYDKISAAERNLNYDTFAQAVTNVSEPTSIWIAPNGKSYSLTEYLALRKKAMKQVSTITTDIYTVLSVRADGDTATERTHALISGMETDTAANYGMQGAAHAVSVDRLYETSWVKYATGWKIHSVRVVSSALTVDGKLVTPPTPKTTTRATRRRSTRSPY